MTSQPSPATEAPRRSLRWVVFAVLSLACALAALLAAASDVYADVPQDYGQGVSLPAATFCGSAYDITLFERDGYTGGEIPANQAEIDMVCVREADRRMVLAGLLALGAAAALVLALRSRLRRAKAVPLRSGSWSGGGRPVVDRIGAMIGLFYFLVSITVAAVLGSTAWWVNQQEQPAALAYVGIVLGAGLLLLLPRLPRQTFLACGTLAFLLYGAGVMLGLPTVLMALVALFGVTLWTDRRGGLWALAASLGALAVAVVLLFLRYGFYLPPIETFLSDRVAIFLFNSSGVVVLTWAVADQVRAARERRALEHESEAHAAEAAAHQVAEQAARGQVEALADRQRIAREMHDIVAHGLSVIIVQADGARFAAATDPDAAPAALATIAATGRSSLAEMRRLLSVLRDDTAPIPEGPQPGLADVPALVKTLVDTGRDVRLTVHGSLSESADSEAVGLTAYRTVQEALTNVMKHAGEEPTAWVTLTVEPRQVKVEVVDDGPGANESPPTGHGLRGMAERVDMVGGHLVTGPDPRGGFRVLATLPRGGNG